MPDFGQFALADIVIAAVLLLAMIVGAKKGLLKSLAGVVIVAASFIGAAFIADALADPVAKWLQPMVEGYVQESLAADSTADAGTMLEMFHFSGESLEKLVEEVMEKVSQTGMTVLHAVSESVTHSIAYAAVYLVAFLALLVALWLLSQPLHLAAKLPGLRALNALGGGALGLIWGALLVFLAVWLMQRFNWVITAEMVENSALLHFFATNSPISLITSL